MNEDGDASLCRTICIHGRAKAVTRNLYEALLRIRDRHAGERIWIDAICIDQQSDEERTAQVRVMGQIFANARQVLVWLGEGGSESENWTAVQVLRCFARGKHEEDRAHGVRDAQGRSLSICMLHEED